MSDTRACPVCGETILAVARKCKHCGEYLDGPPGGAAAAPAGPHKEGYGGAEYVVPMMKNGWALAARILAYFAFLPGLGFFAAVPAIILGILGLSYCKRNPGSLGRGSSIFAIVWSLVWSALWGGLILVGIASK